MWCDPVAVRTASPGEPSPTITVSGYLRDVSSFWGQAETECVPQRVVLVVGYPDLELLDLACPSDVFATANRQGATPPYDVRFATRDGSPIRTSCGVQVGAQVALERAPSHLDTLIVAGGHGHFRAAEDEWLVHHVARLARHSRRVVSVCTGVSVLAAAGLLDGRRATTHWWHAEQISSRFPSVRVDPAPLYVQDGNRYTCAGVTSALDLSLSLVEEDHGPTLAREVARTLVTYLHRPGNQAQISMQLAAPAPEDHLVRDLVAHVTGSPAADLSTTTLAERCGLSARHLRRLFAKHLNTTPARFVRTSRTDAAAELLHSSDLPLSAIARRCGFGSTETLRQAFLERHDVTPSRYRERLRAKQSSGQPTQD